MIREHCEHELELKGERSFFEPVRSSMSEKGPYYQLVVDPHGSL